MTFKNLKFNIYAFLLKINKINTLNRILGLQFSNTNENVKWCHFVAQMTCEIETLEFIFPHIYKLRQVNVGFN